MGKENRRVKGLRKKRGLADGVQCTAMELYTVLIRERRGEGEGQK